MMAMHHLSFLTPVKVTNNVTWTPSIVQSKESFFKTIKNEQQITAEMGIRRSQREKKEILPHPMIFEILNKGKYVVAIGETFYDCTSFIDAVDAAFKIYVILNIPFSPECSKVWRFLNEIFYKLDLELTPDPKLMSMVSSFK